MQRVLTVVVGLYLLWSLVLSAQAPSDAVRREVQVQALLQVLGPAPYYEHPAGTAPKFCLGADAFPTRRAGGDATDLAPVRRLLAKATGVTVASPEHCSSQRAPTFQIVDRDSGELALLLGVGPPEQVAPDTLWIQVSVRLAGLSG